MATTCARADVPEAEVQLATVAEDVLRAHGVVVVGLSGKIGSGKTTLADALQSALPSAVARNFADRLKEEVAMHLDIDVSLCYTHDGKNMRLDAYDMTLGEMLQRWGTMLRALHPDIWVLALESWVAARVREHVDGADGDGGDGNEAPLVVIVGDVRFANEVDWVHRVGGVVVRLDGDPAGERARSRRDLQHVSETALDDHYDQFDLVIDTTVCDRSATALAVLALVAAKFA